jgi:hypothetical protein
MSPNTAHAQSSRARPVQSERPLHHDIRGDLARDQPGNHSHPPYRRSHNFETTRLPEPGPIRGWPRRCHVSGTWPIMLRPPSMNEAADSIAGPPGSPTGAIFKHVPHPRIVTRKMTGPAKTSDLRVKGKGPIGRLNARFAGPARCATTLPSFGEQEGRHLVLGVHPMLMVDTDVVVVEGLLLAGELTCPACGGVLAPWGQARWRSSRLEVGAVRHRPRPASCKGYAKTHVLLPAMWLLRRADAASVIGRAILAKAARPFPCSSSLLKSPSAASSPLNPGLQTQ